MPFYYIENREPKEYQHFLLKLREETNNFALETEEAICGFGITEKIFKLYQSIISYTNTEHPDEDKEHINLQMYNDVLMFNNLNILSDNQSSNYCIFLVSVQKIIGDFIVNEIPCT